MNTVNKVLSLFILFFLLTSKLFSYSGYSEFIGELEQYLESKGIESTEVADTLGEVYSIIDQSYVIKLSPDEKSQLLTDLFNNIQNKVKQGNSVVTGQDVLKIAIDSLLDNLDSYSSWMNAEEYGAFNAKLDGSYKGIGIAISVDKLSNSVIVSQVYKGSNADKAGVKSGDTILQVDKVELKNGDTDQAASLIRGRQGTFVELLLARGKGENQENLTIEVERDVVKIITSEISFIKDDILYIDIDYFNRPVLVDFEEFFANNQDNYSGVIIDLRDNPGGLFYETIQILNSIIDEGVVVSVKIPDEEELVSYVSRPLSSFDKKVPIVVLINEQTASSAEIFAAAMQDNEMATIIGKTSYGKGSIQTIFDLKDQSALKITTQLFYTPSQFSIQGQGVVPNVLIEEGEQTDLAYTQQQDKKAVALDKEFKKTTVTPSQTINVEDCKPYNNDAMLGCAIMYLEGDK